MIAIILKMIRLLTWLTNKVLPVMILIPIGFSPPAYSNGFQHADLKKIVVYQVFENSTSSFTVDESGDGEFAVWTNGRIRERHKDAIDKKQQQKLFQMLKALPPLSADIQPAQSNLQDEPVFEQDKFTIYTSDDCISNSLKRAPEAYADFLDFSTKTGKSLKPVSTDGLFVLSYPADPSEYQVEEVYRISPESLKVMPTLSKSLVYPYKAIRMEDIDELKKIPELNTISYYISTDSKNVYFVQYLDGGNVHLLDILNK